MLIAVNMPRVTEFLVELLNTPSPTGYHQEAIAFVRRAFESIGLPNLSTALTVKGDVKFGENVILKGKVRLVNSSDRQQLIEAGAVIEGELEL